MTRLPESGCQAIAMPRRLVPALQLRVANDYGPTSAGTARLGQPQSFSAVAELLDRALSTGVLDRRPHSQGSGSMTVEDVAAFRAAPARVGLRTADSSMHSSTITVREGEAVRVVPRLDRSLRR